MAMDTSNGFDIYMTDLRGGGGAWLALPMPWDELHEQVQRITKDGIGAITRLDDHEGILDRIGLDIDPRTNPDGILQRIDMDIDPLVDPDLLNATAILLARAEPDMIDALAALAQIRREHTGRPLTPEGYASVLILTENGTPIPYTPYRDGDTSYSDSRDRYARLASSLLHTGTCTAADRFADAGYADCINLYALGRRITRRTMLLPADNGYIDANRPIPSTDAYDRDAIIEHVKAMDPTAATPAGLPDWDLSPDLINGTGAHTR